jgi:hypothetical protein
MAAGSSSSLYVRHELHQFFIPGELLEFTGGSRYSCQWEKMSVQRIGFECIAREEPEEDISSCCL